MKKRKNKSRGLILLLIIIAFGYYVYNMYQADQKLNDYLADQVALKAEIEQLEREINRLADEYAYAQTPEAIEKIAREKLKMVKPNEIIYLLKETATSEEGD